MAPPVPKHPTENLLALPPIPFKRTAGSNVGVGQKVRLVARNDGRIAVVDISSEAEIGTIEGELAQQLLSVITDEHCHVNITATTMRFKKVSITFANQGCISPEQARLILMPKLNRDQSGLPKPFEMEASPSTTVSTSTSTSVPLARANQPAASSANQTDRLSRLRSIRISSSRGRDEQKAFKYNLQRSHGSKLNTNLNLMLIPPSELTLKVYNANALRVQHNGVDVGEVTRAPVQLLAEIVNSIDRLPFTMEVKVPSNEEADGLLPLLITFVPKSDFSSSEVFDELERVFGERWWKPKFEGGKARKKHKSG